MYIAATKTALLKSMRLRLSTGNLPNKQFKWDSARVAFLVCVGFGVAVPCGNLVIACFTP
ncbi:DUF3265 domain-containing protein [Vibrio parahaemolyticus]|nr:DUF3265 domain-containing protein [Vibrio parahaemolyticus]TOE46943.1 DUF3265 domain-containing protein [Vibrio parahaemolyticus]TOF29606.1 DUF3265 domain-containing protein [Vibrio parahaemolyticus]TOH24748.1 DUF3265 domain-containing protein [Vibrio parahaemolyticus]TOH26743.1 DUF3265 domain-containing protein [Vibrio parahaemolyticus]